MRILVYIISSTLIFFGFAMGAMLPHTAKYASMPTKPISFGLLLFVWGLLLHYSVRHNYRGGAATYVGMVLFGLGMWQAVGVVTWLHGAQVLENASAAILLIVSGVALLIYGHRHHVRKVNRGH